MDVLPRSSLGPIAQTGVVTQYVILLLSGKFLKSLGVYLTFDLLKSIHIVQFLFIVKVIASVAFFVLQKPFKGKKLSRRQIFLVFRHSCFSVAVCLLWLFALTLCGPLRTNLIFEQSDTVVIAAAAVFFGTSHSSNAKSRGMMLFLVAIVVLLFFDVDNPLVISDHPEGYPHKNAFTHFIFWTISLFGLSDHKGGLILLFVALLLHVAMKSQCRKLSVDIGGSKRLQALSTMTSAVLLSPWVMYCWATSIETSLPKGWFDLIIPLLLSALLVFLIDFYFEAFSVSKLGELSSGRCVSAAVVVCSLFLASVWNHPMVIPVATSMSHPVAVTEDHALTPGVWIGGLLLLISSYILTTANPRGSQGNFVGYSSGGQPLFVFADQTLQRAGASLVHHSKEVCKQILASSDSQWIAFFLCINLFFTFVELVYGAWTNSLGLISDGFHMLFDCTALVMGLVAAVISRWPPSSLFPYGFGRFEVLSGFVNGIFLIVVASCIVLEGFHRLVDPPEVKTEQLLAVSVAGLLVNLIGILAFTCSGHGHSHGGGGGGSHGHSHGGNTNMRGVFLHVMADTLGSVGVIVSSLLIQYFGWLIADPLCSLFIGILILISVAPLLLESGSILLLRTPDDCEEDLDKAFKNMKEIEGFRSYKNPHFWTHSSTLRCGVIHVQVQDYVNEQKVIQQITAMFKHAGISSMTVQVQKDSFFQHISGLSRDGSVDRAFRTFQSQGVAFY